MKKILSFTFLFFIISFLYGQKRSCPSCINKNKPAYYNSNQNFKKAQRDHSLRTATGEKVPVPSVENNFNQNSVGEVSKVKNKKSKKKKNTPIRQ